VHHGSQSTKPREHQPRRRGQARSSFRSEKTRLGPPARDQSSKSTRWTKRMMRIDANHQSTPKDRQATFLGVKNRDPSAGGRCFYTTKMVLIRDSDCVDSVVLVDIHNSAAGNGRVLGCDKAYRSRHRQFLGQS